MNIYKHTSLLALINIAMLWLGMMTAAGAQPVTPSIYVNGSCTLADAPKRGKVQLIYDVRSIGGQGLELYIELLPRDPQDKEPFKTLHFQGSCGHCDLDFKEEPVGIYAIWARACDAQGQVFAAPTHIVTFRYGGRKGMEQSEERKKRLFGTSKPAAFSEIIALDERPKLIIAIDPQASVVKPGGKARLSLKVAVDNAKNVQAIYPDLDQNVYWKLDGEGKLTDLTPTDALYLAPDHECQATIGVRINDNEAYGKIYVTDKEPGDDVTPSGSGDLPTTMDALPPIGSGL